LAASLLQDDEYTATASIMFRDPALAVGLVGGVVPEAPADVVQDISTNVNIVSLPDAADRASRSLGSLTPDEARDAISVGQAGLSRVVNVSAQTTHQNLAAPLANAYARAAIDIRRAADRRTIEATLARARAGLRELNKVSSRVGAPSARETNRAATLRRTIDALVVFRALHRGDVTLIREAVRPTAVSSRSPAKSAVYGLLFGAILGVGLALMLYLLDRRVRDELALERALGVPILGVVSPDQTREEGRAVVARSRGAGPQGMRSIALASATAGEGREEVARQIVAAAAEAGARTLFIEGDREARVPSGWDFTGGPGLTEVVSGECSLEEVTRPQASPGLSLHMIGPGLRPGLLLEQDACRAVLSAAGDDYELVVVDVAPLTRAAEAIPLLASVDGIVAVGHLDRTTTAEAEDLIAELALLRPPVLGAIAVSAVREESAGPLRTDAAGRPPKHWSRSWV
jgi:Mrp family chromosome partitioning ATPase